MSEHVGFTDRVMAFFRANPGRWIHAVELEQFGRQAWRTRVSEARQRFVGACEGSIENRVRKVCEFTDCGHLHRFTISEYRYVPAEPVQPSAPGQGPHDLNAWELR